MANKISKSRKIVGWITVFIGLVFIVNGIDHLVNEEQFFDELYRDFLFATNLISLQSSIGSAILGTGLLFDTAFIVLNLDYIPLFIIGIILILVARKFIFKIPFRGKN